MLHMGQVSKLLRDLPTYIGAKIAFRLVSDEAYEDIIGVGVDYVSIFIERFEGQLEILAKDLEEGQEG